jgi:DNA ligase-1
MIKELITLAEIELLTGNGSQKEKQRLISENLTEEMLYILDVCFNPFVTTKLHKLEMKNGFFGIASVCSDFPGFQTFKDLVEDLKKAPAANDSLRGRANHLINCKISPDPKEDAVVRNILMKILTKRMNIGIGAKLINKAVGKELIPDPSVMLACDDQKEIASWGKIYCEEKYDGVRVIAVGDRGKGFQFYTRAFNELDKTKLSQIELSLGKVLHNANIVGEVFFDGELTDINRKSVSGKVTQILKGTAPNDIDKDFLFNVFDIEKAEVLKTGKGTTPFIKRRAELEFVLGFLEANSPVTLARQWVVDSMEETHKIYGLIIANGGEGVILKPENHLYECKRSKSWVKLKQIQDCDLEITGWYPGEGKREGFIGGFICTDSSKTLVVKIGSGFTDKDLQELSSDPDSLIGKIAAVQYNEPITDKFGNRSLFLPRFIEIRHDKNLADDLSKMF